MAKNNVNKKKEKLLIGKETSQPIRVKLTETESAILNQIRAQMVDPESVGSNENRAKMTTETENSFLVGVRRYGDSDRDRLDYDREDVLQDALEAWRLNPLARRIVELTSQYVVGNGLVVSVRHVPTARFLDNFWHNRLNRMPVRVYEWCDELTRTGNLFVLITTDQAGMSYVRAVPAQDIEIIIHAANDIEQPIHFTSKPDEHFTVSDWSAYDEQTDGEQETFEPVMLHYAINRPVGGQWGESDLAPILRWLTRYSSWLEDRARLNRFRNSFMYVVTGQFTSEAERATRQATLSATPPTPGSILVTDETEKWSVIEPKLDSQDAATDGLALKKMIAVGAGVPLHFLAEPESSTRTTAEAAGGPTYRRFEERQGFFTWLVGDVLRVIVNRRALVDRKVSKAAEIEVNGADISARDNMSLAMAATNMVNGLIQLKDYGLMDDGEILRLVYRFAGENINPEEILQRIEEARKEKKEQAPASVSKADHVISSPNMADKPSASEAGHVEKKKTHPVIGASTLDPTTGEPAK